jgi:ketosteroid isomerase-like protein
MTALSLVVVVAAGVMLEGSVRPSAEGSPEAAPSDRIAIRNARIAQNRAIAAGDIDRVASFWTDDVTVRRGLGLPVNGRAASRQAFEPTGTAAPRLIYRRRTTGIEVSSNWPLAFETGTWEGHLGSMSGPTVIGGRYSAQWVKRGGRWLIRSEVFVALSCAGVGCQSAAEP